MGSRSVPRSTGAQLSEVSGLNATPPAHRGTGSLPCGQEKNSSHDAAATPGTPVHRGTGLKAQSRNPTNVPESPGVPGDTRAPASNRATAVHRGTGTLFRMTGAAAGGKWFNTVKVPSRDRRRSLAGNAADCVGPEAEAREWGCGTGISGTQVLGNEARFTVANGRKRGVLGFRAGVPGLRTQSYRDLGHSVPGFGTHDLARGPGIGAQNDLLTTRIC